MKKEETQEKLNVGARFNGIPVRHDTTVPLKSKKGITLIALVITIIVLLILAGVTLSIVFNGGIINKSQTAVDKYTEESAKEKLSLAIFNYKMGKITGEAGEVEEKKSLNDYILEIGGKATYNETEGTYTVILDGYEFIVGDKNYEITSNGPVTGESPEIKGKTFDLVGDEHLSAIIKVTASATKGGALKVTIGGQEAKLENGTYNLTVTNNGKYTIVVSETGLARKAVETVEVSGIEKIKYTVTINMGTGIAGVTPTTEQQVEKGQSIEITATAQTGYTFSKWKVTSGNESDVASLTSATTTVKPTENITIEATAGKQLATIADGNNLTGSANGTLNGKAATYQNPVIPAGFKTSSEGASWSLSANGTYVTGWNDGLVIEDESKNQFVWVPAQIVGTGITNVVEYKKWCTTNIAYNHSNITGDDLPNLPDGVTETTQIETYGGFYIGRYEASQGTNSVPQTQYDKPFWADIGYETANTNAQKYKKENSNVLSGLLTGTMWDTVLAWIDKSEAGYSTSISYGNYSGTKANTGKTASDCVKNIYDLAGNVEEWTSENYSSYRMMRGGPYNNQNALSPAHRSFSSNLKGYSNLRF